MSKPRRPKTIAIGALKAYPKRPPLESDPDQRWSWQVVYHDGDKQITVKGQGGRRSVPEMHRVLAELSEVGGWREEREPDDKVRTIRTVNDLLDAWLREQEARHERGKITATTLRSKRSHAKGLRPLLGEVHVLDLCEEDVQGWSDDSGDAPRTQVVRWGIMRSVWKWARESKGLELGPLPGLELPNVRADEYTNAHATPTQEQAVVMVESLTGWQRIAGEIMLNTGCRVSEVGRLLWEDYSDGVLSKQTRAPTARAQYTAGGCPG